MVLSIDALPWFRDKVDCQMYRSKKANETSIEGLSYFHFVERSLSARSVDDITALCDLVARHYGYNHFGVGLVYPIKKQRFLCHYLHCDNHDWAVFYRDHLLFVDPFSDHCIRHTSPLTWMNDADSQAALRVVSPVVSDAFEQFGVMNALSIPYHRKGRVIGCFRLMCLHEQSLSQADMDKGIAELHSLTAYVLDALNKVLSGDIDTNDHDRGAALLTSKEQYVLSLIVKGYSTHQMALALHISENTVLTHTKKIYKKLGVNNRQLAVVRALSLGVLTE